MKLSQKFLSLFIGFLIVLLLCLTLFLYFFTMRQARTELLRRYNNLGTDLAEICTQMINNQNPGFLYVVLKNKIEQRMDFNQVRYLRVIDLSGRIYFSLQKNEENQASNYRNDVALLDTVRKNGIQTKVTQIVPGSTRVYDSSIPLHTDFGAYILRIGLVFHVYSRMNIGDLFILLIFMSGLALVFALLISRLIVRPIETLTRDAGKIASGRSEDFSSLQLRTDEIGDLARALHNLLQQLKQKQKELAESEKLAILGKGTGRLTHNISNLLNPLDHCFKTIRQQITQNPISARMQESLNTVEKNMDLVITNLNKLRKAIPDQPIRERYPVSVLLETALARFIIPATVHIEKEYGAERIELWADPEQMTMVFYNLIQNAIQAMESRQGRLTISVKKMNDEAWIVFTDTGCGISDEQKKDIFQFFTSTKKDGMGIGLASAMEVVRNHGGTIAVESSPDTGSTFIVKLPL